MHTKRRVHDGIVGALIVGGVALGYWVSPTPTTSTIHSSNRCSASSANRDH